MTPDAKFVVKLWFAFLPLWLFVCETLLLRDSILCNTCRGTQRVTGTVSNEATSGMGREDRSSSWTCNRSGPCADQIGKSQAPELAGLEQEFCAYNICTSDGCE